MKPGFCFVIIMLAVANIATIVFRTVVAHAITIPDVSGLVVNIVLILIAAICWGSHKIIRYDDARKKIRQHIWDYYGNDPENLPTDPKDPIVMILLDMDKFDTMTEQHEIDLAMGCIKQKAINLGIIKWQDHSTEVVERLISIARD